MEDKIAFIIPCYNESLTIEKVVKDCKSAIPEATIYVYDNNSTDGTADIAKKAGAIVRHEYQQGKGNVVRTMFREIFADCYIMLDGDDTNPPEFAPEMADLVLNKGVDMVVGDRLSSTYFEENKRPFHNVGNSLVRGLINSLFKSDIKDIMTGYRAFSYKFVKTYPILSKGFEIETEMTIHTVANNLSTANVVTDYRDRPEGSKSKLNTYSDGFKVLKTIFRLFKNYRPMLFFNLFAIIMFVVSLFMFIPILMFYFKTKTVPNFPTLIVSGFVMMAGLMSLFVGLILNVTAEKNRKDFEYRLQEVTYQKKLMEQLNEKSI